MSLRRLLQGGNVLGAVIDDVDTSGTCFRGLCCRRSPAPGRRGGRCRYPAWLLRPPCRQFSTPQPGEPVAATAAVLVADRMSAKAEQRLAFRSHPSATPRGTQGRNCMPTVRSSRSWKASVRWTGDGNAWHGGRPGPKDPARGYRRRCGAGALPPPSAAPGARRFRPGDDRRRRGSAAAGVGGNRLRPAERRSGSFRRCVVLRR